MNPEYIHTLDDLDNRVGFPRKDFLDMEKVCEVFPFKANDYYLSLIDWKNDRDPLRKILVPDPRELKGGGSLDPSSEKDYTKLPGLQHKYPQTGLLLLSDVCGGICRFCFRKRLFMDREQEAVKDVSGGIEYIREHPEMTNVLLTGGDPLTLETSYLEKILRELREISHVNIIRIGSKIPAYNPFRILNDPRLREVFSRFSSAEKRIYLVAHFTHPHELTSPSLQALEQLQASGVKVVHQTPLLNEVNSTPETLASLFSRLSFAGVTPYYVFQCRPSLGNRFFQVPVEQSYQIIQQAWQACSGLAKSARFVISHATGKIEVVGKTATHVVMRYHQAANPIDIGRTLVYRSNPMARWFDDYLHQADSIRNLMPVRMPKMPKMQWLF
jgi:KamA family protein